MRRYSDFENKCLIEGAVASRREHFSSEHRRLSGRVSDPPPWGNIVRSILEEAHISKEFERFPCLWIGMPVFVVSWDSLDPTLKDALVRKLRSCKLCRKRFATGIRYSVGEGFWNSKREIFNSYHNDPRFADYDPDYYDEELATEEWEKWQDGVRKGIDELTGRGKESLEEEEGEIF